MLISVFDMIKMFDAQAFFFNFIEKLTRNSFKYAKVWSLGGQLKKSQEELMVNKSQTQVSDWTTRAMLVLWI